jgi:anaerobic magnesium-protoporphyrin IX monomethyl ester cyclase
MKISLIHPRLIYLPSQAPLGLGYIAASLEKAGHTVQFIEGAFTPDDETIAGMVKNFGAEIVGISVMISYYSKSLELAEIIKKASPQATVIFGGPHPSVVPEDFIKFDAIDYVLVGEGEVSFTIMADAMEKGAFHPEKIPGLRWKDGAADLARSHRITDLDAVPWPARHLMPMGEYRHRGLNVSYGMFGGNFNLITTRGCPFRCNFCDHTIYGHKAISRSIKDIVDEIEYTGKTYRIRNFDVMDDTFTMSQKYVLAFCDEMMKRKLDYFWCCRLRVSGVTRDMMRRMSEAGCIRFSVGIESADERVLKAINKTISIPEVVQVLKWAKEFGMLTIGNFMIGNIGDTRASIEKTLRFSLETKEIDIPSWVVLTPLPGTVASAYGKERGWIRSFDWDDYRMNIKDLPVWRNEALSHEDLQQIYGEVAEKVRPKISHAMEVLHEGRRKFYPELKETA